MTTTAGPQRTDPIPAWVAYSGVAGVGGVALAVLAYYQHRFGVEQAQMPGLLSWTFSIGLDWGSIVAGVFWFLGSGKLAAWGRAFSILLLLGSTALTCISFGLIAGWPFAPLGAIHSVVAFAMAKLLTLWQADRRARRGQVDALDAYRAELDQMAAEIAAARAEIADQEAELADQRTALEDERTELAEQAELLQQQRHEVEQARQQLAATSRRTPIPAPTKDVPPAGQNPESPAGGDSDLVREIAEWIKTERAAGRTTGQRRVREQFGVPRPRAAELIAAAEALLQPHVNGKQYPIPTTGATP